MSSCINCEFFRRIPAYEISDSGTGACHRFPPAPVSKDSEEVIHVAAWSFPIVDGEWWCGEFKKRKGKK